MVYCLKHADGKDTYILYSSVRYYKEGFRCFNLLVPCLQTIQATWERETTEVSGGWDKNLKVSRGKVWLVKKNGEVREQDG